MHGVNKLSIYLSICVNSCERIYHSWSIMMMLESRPLILGGSYRTWLANDCLRKLYPASRRYRFYYALIADRNFLFVRCGDLERLLERITFQLLQISSVSLSIHWAIHTYKAGTMRPVAAAAVWAATDTAVPLVCSAAAAGTTVPLRCAVQLNMLETVLVNSCWLHLCFAFCLAALSCVWL